MRPLLTFGSESGITNPMRVQDFDKEPRPTWGEEMFPSSNRIPESGSWAATIVLWVLAIFSALAEAWPFAIFLALFSLGVCPPINRIESDARQE